MDNIYKCSLRPNGSLDVPKELVERVHNVDLNGVGILLDCDDGLSPLGKSRVLLYPCEVPSNVGQPSTSVYIESEDSTLVVISIRWEHMSTRGNTEYYGTLMSVVSYDRGT